MSGPRPPEEGNEKKKRKKKRKKIRKGTVQRQNETTSLHPPQIQRLGSANSLYITHNRNTYLSILTAHVVWYLAWLPIYKHFVSPDCLAAGSSPEHPGWVVLGNFPLGAKY